MRKRVFGRGSVLLAAALMTSVAVRCSSSMGTMNKDSAGAEQGGPQDATDNTPVTELVESDIYKRDGDRLFVLNRFKGLLVTNLSNLDKPSLQGRLPLPGQGREMWVSGNTALVITSQPTPWGTGWWWGRAPVDVNTWASYKGSALAVADVSDANEPRLVALQALEGDCFDGRLRGNILFLACEAAVDSTWTGTAGASHVYALDVSNPALPHVISDVVFPSSGGAQHISVSPTTMYLSDSAYAYAGETNITLLDITAQDGTVVKRGSVRVAGGVLDRFSMDEFNGVLRVASGAIWGNGNMVVSNFDVSNPDEPRTLGVSDIAIQERVTTARFDGDRGYVVTFKNVDPLFVYDLSDPNNPRITAELEMSGFLDFIVPMGHRLLAMGHEVVEDNNSGWRGMFRMTHRTLAVSLIDVEGDPRLLSRVPLDGAWGTIPAERDDYNKLFRVFPDEGLVVFPYRTFSRYGYSQTAGMLLLDLQGDSLTLRKDMKGLGLVERGILWDPSTLVTLSLQCLQVFNIANHAEPTLRGRLELAQQVSEFVVLPDNTVVELGGDFGVGQATLRAHGLDAPVHQDMLSTTYMDAPTGHIFANGSLVYFVGMHKPYSPYVYSYGNDDEEEPQEHTTVTVVDFANPAAPVVRSTMSLNAEVLFGSTYYSYSANTRSAVQASPGVLVLMQPARYRYAGCSDKSDPATLHVVDLRNPDQPRTGSVLAAHGWGATGLQAGPSHTFLMTYNGVYVLDVSDPANAHMNLVRAPQVLAVSADSEDIVGAETDTNSGKTDLIVWNLEGNELRQKARRTMGQWWTSTALAGQGLVALGGYQNVSILALSDLHDVASMAQLDSASPVQALQPGHVITRDAYSLHVNTLNAQGLQEVASFPVAGEAQAAEVRDGVIYVAAGYYGFIRYAPVPQ